MLLVLSCLVVIIVVIGFSGSFCEFMFDVVLIGVVCGLLVSVDGMFWLVSSIV